MGVDRDRRPESVQVFGEAKLNLTYPDQSPRVFTVVSPPIVLQGAAARLPSGSCNAPMLRVGWR